MSTVRAALCFYNRGLVDALGELAENAAGRVIINFQEPVGVSYLLSDSDHFHVATRYGCLIGDVPPRVTLIYISGNLDERAEQIITEWNAIIELHRVRSQVPWSELAGIKSEFKSSCDHELAEIARERVSTAFGRLETLRNPCSEGLLTPSLSQSLNTHRQNVQQHGGMITRRQREAAEARRRVEQEAAAQWRLDWTNTEIWYAPGPSGAQVAFFINQMEPKHLWETICWAVANYLRLFNQYHGHAGHDSVALIAKRWLSAQPAFRALVQEAVRRRITFPPEVFRYLREYMLGRNTVEIAVSAPWEDPRLAHQTEELASFVDAPLHLPEEIDPTSEFGREFRDIAIDDT